MRGATESPASVPEAAEEDYDVSMSARLLAVFFLLLCQACTHLTPGAGAHVFQFDDGGNARYFVLDKRPARDAAPSTFLFMIPGSDCGSMLGVLPGYFDGLTGGPGGMRIFVLHKRFTGADADGECSADFVRADHPQRWLADQEAFIRTELAAARDGGHAPARVVIAGSSEGAEIAPLLARRIPGVTHVVLLANGGMDPIDAFRLQMQREGTPHAPQELARQCRAGTADTIVLGRTCRYWRELQAIRHTDNLLALDIPVFIAMGEADAMVPVESALYIRDRFAARGKTNLQLLILPGAGHDFRREAGSVLPYLWERIDEWLQK